MKATAVALGLRQINLLNTALLPTRELISARLILIWVVIAILAMAAVGYWAVIETNKLRREVATQAGRQAAEKARILLPAPDGEVLPSAQQVAALETNLRDKNVMLETRRAVRDTLKHGAASLTGGPSALLKLFANSVPPQIWLTEVRVSGNRMELMGKTIDPLAVNVMIDRLLASGFIATKPLPTVRLERADAPKSSGALLVHTFGVTAILSSPLADEGGRP